MPTLSLIWLQKCIRSNSQGTWIYRDGGTHWNMDRSKYKMSNLEIFFFNKDGILLKDKTEIFQPTWQDIYLWFHNDCLMTALAISLGKETEEKTQEITKWIDHRRVPSSNTSHIEALTSFFKFKGDAEIFFKSSCLIIFLLEVKTITKIAGNWDCWVCQTLKFGSKSRILCFKA